MTVGRIFFCWYKRSWHFVFPSASPRNQEKKEGVKCLWAYGVCVFCVCGCHLVGLGGKHNSPQLFTPDGLLVMAVSRLPRCSPMSMESAPAPPPKPYPLGPNLRP